MPTKTPAHRDKPGVTQDDRELEKSVKHKMLTTLIGCEPRRTEHPVRLRVSEQGVSLHPVCQSRYNRRPNKDEAWSVAGPSAGAFVHRLVETAFAKETR